MVERGARRIVGAGWLAGIWLLLCGQVSPGTVLSGLAVGAALAALVPLPPLPLRLRVRPLRLAGEVSRLVLNITRSTAALAWAAVRTGPATRSTVITVPLRTEQDALAVVTATWLTLTPGTLVFRIDAPDRELHVHTMPVPGHGAEQVRRDAVRTEARLLAALGERVGGQR